MITITVMDDLHNREDKLPAEIGDEFFEGGIGYHLRKGLHYFSREDWLKLIRFVKLHRNS